MGKHQYTASQLRNAANISRVTYDQWRARGLIKSEHKPEGSGDRQLYSFYEVLVVAVMARLVSLGISVGLAAKAVDPYPSDFRLGGVKPAALHGFKDSRAHLVLRAYPDLEQDGAADTIEYTSTVTEIVREKDLPSKLAKCEGAVVISLDKIEERVKKALAAES
jgi:DNA-binding transcriptional MerR regulator